MEHLTLTVYFAHIHRARLATRARAMRAANAAMRAPVMRAQARVTSPGCRRAGRSMAPATTTRRAMPDVDTVAAIDFEGAKMALEHALVSAREALERAGVRDFDAFYPRR